MPIYAFRCAACGHAFDRLQKLSDPDPGQCPVCAAAAVERQLTAPSFRLSGSGWYETDFKKDGDRKRNLAGEGGGQADKPESKKADAPAEGGKAPDKPSETPATPKAAPAVTQSPPAKPASSA